MGAGWGPGLGLQPETCPSPLCCPPFRDRIVPGFLSWFSEPCHQELGQEGRLVKLENLPFMFIPVCLCLGLEIVLLIGKALLAKELRGRAGLTPICTVRCLTKLCSTRQGPRLSSGLVNINPLILIRDPVLTP